MYNVFPAAPCPSYGFLPPPIVPVALYPLLLHWGWDCHIQDTEVAAGNQNSLIHGQNSRARRNPTGYGKTGQCNSLTLTFLQTR